jgi:hypothetical protein
VIIVGSYAGADIHPAWVHNLRAHPHTGIEIGRTIPLFELKRT